jgi:diguanylate cyclase (GGDEF)-like protein
MAPNTMHTVDGLLDLTAALVELLPSACLLLSPVGEIVSVNRGAACLIDMATAKPRRDRIDTHLDFGDVVLRTALTAASQQGWSGPVRVRDGANAGVRLTARIDALHGRDRRQIGLIARLEPAPASRQPDPDRVDSLTGLPCRQAIERRLAESLAAADAAGQDAALALFRIRMSGLAVVRGIHGRPAVEAVLTTVAGRLKAATRGSDLVGRFADDEFVVAAAVANAQDAAIVTARIERAMDAPIDFEDAAISVRAGIGTAVFPQDGTSPAKLLARAAIVNKLFGV